MTADARKINFFNVTERPADIETTARGAAYAAGLAVGFWGPEGGKSPAEDAKPSWGASSWGASSWREAASTLKKTFEPSVSAQNREKRMQLWKKAVQRTLDWVSEDHDDSKQDHDEDDKEFSK
jgi:glycerol kinase